MSLIKTALTIWAFFFLLKVTAVGIVILVVISGMLGVWE